MAMGKNKLRRQPGTSRTATKRVLFTSHTADFAKFNQPLIQLLHDRGYEVHYASAGEKPIANVDRNFVVDFARSPLKISHHWRAYCQIKKIIDEGDYDLIHTHTPVGSVLTRLAARQARRRGVRVLYTSHGFHFYKGAPLAAWLLWYPIEKYCAPLTDGLVTINHEDFTRAKKHFATKVFIIPGVGVDLTKLSAKVSGRAKSALRASLNLKPDDFVIISVAELNKNKNQQLIIKALPEIAKTYPNARVLFVGDDCLHGKLRKLARACHVESRVRFLDYRSDLPQLFAISNLLVAASRREGLGLGLIEAMAAGLPVLASDNRGHREVVTKQQLFRDNDAADLVDKVAHLAKQNNSGLIEKFSLASSLRAMNKIYRDILGPSYDR